MEKVTINRPVKWKAIVTEQLKEELTQQLQRSLNRVELELQQLEFQAKRILPDLEKQNLKQALTLRNQIQEEREKRRQSKEHIAEQMREVANLSLGQEIQRGTLESWVEVRVGDDLHQLLQVEIVTKDGKVVELREGWAEA